jgi:hypothetical protein
MTAPEPASALKWRPQYRNRRGDVVSVMAVSEGAMTLQDFLDYVSDIPAYDPKKIRVSQIVLHWEEPPTPAEREVWAEWDANRAARTDRWEREAYERLKAKFEPAYPEWDETPGRQEATLIALKAVGLDPPPVPGTIWRDTRPGIAKPGTSRFVKVTSISPTESGWQCRVRAANSVPEGSPPDFALDGIIHARYLVSDYLNVELT